MERRLSAVLAADVVGYSRLMDLDEARTLHAVREIQANIVERTIKERRGKVVKRMGDGWLAEFISAADAVNCAVSIQSLMRDSELSLRIGVNVGDITHIDGDIFGSGVNVAARLESVAADGGVAISDDVRRLMRDAVEAEFHPNGAIELKNIQVPVEVWSWPTPLVHLKASSVVKESKPKLWLGAFDANGTAASEMAVALRDDLGHVFGRQTGLTLVQGEDGADFALIATLRSSGDRWRAGFRLNEVSTGNSVWTDRFEERGKDEFEIQDRFSQRIAGSVRIRIPALLSEKLRTTPLQDMTVEQLLNHAMGCNFVPNVESWARSRAALELALEQDPENWMAMTMLCWNNMGMTRVLNWREMNPIELENAQEMIEGATRLMPNDHVVRSVRGTLSLFGHGDLAAARADLEEALSLNPNFYHAINSMSLVELASGDIEKATKQANIALTCEPAYPYRHLYYRDAGLIALLSGNNESASQYLMYADRSAPDLPANLALLSAALQGAGQIDAAQRQLARLKRVAEDFDPWRLANLPFREEWMSSFVPKTLSSI